MIYCNAHLTADAIAELKAGISAHRLLISSQPSGNLGAGTVDPLLDQAEIAFGQPDAVQAMQLASLKWIQVTSAGYTRYDNAAFASAIRQRKGILTNSSSVFAETLCRGMPWPSCFPPPANSAICNRVNGLTGRCGPDRGSWLGGLQYWSATAPSPRTS